MSGVELSQTKLHPRPLTTTATTPLVSPTAAETCHHTRQIISRLSPTAHELDTLFVSLCGNKTPAYQILSEQLLIKIRTIKKKKNA